MLDTKQLSYITMADIVRAIKAEVITRTQDTNFDNRVILQAFNNVILDLETLDN